MSINAILERNASHVKPRGCCGTHKWENHKKGCQYATLMHPKSGRQPNAMQLAFAKAVTG